MEQSYHVPSNRENRFSKQINLKTIKLKTIVLKERGSLCRKTEEHRTRIIQD